MKKNILDFIDSGRENGLLLVDPNTGSGKRSGLARQFTIMLGIPITKRKSFSRRLS